jgi:hypothetical protein
VWLLAGGVGEDEGRAALERVGNAQEIVDVVHFEFGDESRYMNGRVVGISSGLQ